MISGAPTTSDANVSTGGGRHLNPRLVARVAPSLITLKFASNRSSKKWLTFFYVQDPAFASQLKESLKKGKDPRTPVSIRYIPDPNSRSPSTRKLPLPDKGKQEDFFVDDANGELLPTSKCNISPVSGGGIKSEEQWVDLSLRLVKDQVIRELSVRFSYKRLEATATVTALPVEFLLTQQTQ